jgi:uncharacterized protein YjlB
MGSLHIVATTKSVLPELDLTRIRRYSEGRVPARLRDQFPIARLRHVAARGVWELYWRDRNLNWHHYDRTAPAAHVEPLLAEIQADPTAIFWG